METQKTLETATKVLRIMTIPIFSWPLPADTSRKTVLVRNICFWIVIIHTILFSSVFFIDIYRSALKGHDIDHAIKIFAELSAVFLLLAAISLTKTEEARLRVLLDELQSFVDQANEEQLEVIQFYLDKTMGMHKMIVYASVVGLTAYICEPMVLADTFLPVYVRYPFPLDAWWAYWSTYFSQTIVIIQIGAMVISDSMWALLLWYTGARFDMLCKQVGRASTHADVRNCILEHQNLLEYVERLKIPVRLIITVLLAICSISILAGGLVLMSRPPLFVAIKFTCFEVPSILRLFVFSWPADNLMSMSERIAVAIYECDWVGKSPAMLKDMLFLMHRAQEPVVLALPGITDALTLEFYTGIMKAIFSYLLTLNAMLDT